MRIFRDKEMQEYHDAVVEKERLLAYHRGRVETLREQLAEDEVIRENCRRQSWRQTGAEPGDGWPEGVDADRVVQDWVRERTACLELDAEAPPAERTPVSESVSAFRKAIGGTT